MSLVSFMLNYFQTQLVTFCDNLIVSQPNDESMMSVNHSQGRGFKKFKKVIILNHYIDLLLTIINQINYRRDRVDSQLNQQFSRALLEEVIWSTSDRFNRRVDIIEIVSYLC